jgi:hypothetical protein
MHVTRWCGFPTVGGVPPLELGLQANAGESRPDSLDPQLYRLLMPTAGRRRRNDRIAVRLISGHLQ